MFDTWKGWVLAAEGGVGAGAGAVRGGGGGGGFAASCLQAAKTSGSAAASATNAGRVECMANLPFAQDLAGIFSCWPGKILSGSFRTSRFASKIRFHSFAFP